MPSFKVVLYKFGVYSTQHAEHRGLDVEALQKSSCSCVL